MQSIAPWWMWLDFFIFVSIMLMVDVFVVGSGKAHKVSLREASSWTLIWMILALSFNLLLWRYLDHTLGRATADEKGLAFLTGYLIEFSLSVDNMFVFIMIFNYFAVPIEYQRRVLIFGVVGAIFMRLAMILGGVWLVAKFHWLLYIFGAFLVITGIKMLIMAEKKANLAENPLLVWMRKHLRVTSEFHDERFFIKKNNLRYATPLFLIVVLIEIGDLVFALDSIPAIFAITDDPFIIFTSNIFAILGLRSLYFLLANLSDRFNLLKYGVAIILVFVGCKMLAAHWFEIPIQFALGFIVATLGICVALSHFRKNQSI